MSETEFLNRTLVGLATGNLPEDCRQRLLIACRLMKNGQESDWNAALSWFTQSAEERRQARNGYLKRAVTVLHDLGENPKQLPRRIADGDLPEAARDLIAAAAVCWRLPKTEKQLRKLLQ